LDNQALATSTVYPVNDPHETSKKLYDVHGIVVDDVAKVVESSQKALPAWRDTPPTERRNLFLKAAAILREKIPEIAAIHAKETT
jgi:acyl-CoA reductase-like NAD-dependent aldehyde dehydrogenase